MDQNTTTNYGVPASDQNDAWVFKKGRTLLIEVEITKETPYHSSDLMQSIHEMGPFRELKGVINDQYKVKTIFSKSYSEVKQDLLDRTIKGVTEIITSL